MSYDDTSFYGDMIVDEYDDKCNFIGTNTPMGYLAYHLLGDGFDLMSDMCSKFMNDFNILTADSSSLDKFWGVSYNMSRPSLPYLYTVLFEDVGTVQSHNDSWWRNAGTDNRTVSANGTTLANTTSTRYDIFAYFGTAYDIYVFQSPFTVEFDVVNYTVSGSNRAKMQIYDKDTNIQYNVVDGVGHWKIVCDGTTCMTYKDGVKINEESKNIQKARVGFYIQQNCSITYKNFRIAGIVYPILFSDGGTISNYSNWDNVSSTVQMTRQDTYTELKRKTDASAFGYIVKELSVTDGITIEFDFKQATIPSSNDQYFSFRDSQGNTKLGISRNYQSLNDGKWHHYKFDVNGLTVTPTIDGVQKSNLTLSDSWSRIQLEARNNAVQHFKNFVIYNSESPVYSTRLLSDEEYRVYLYLRNCRLITKEDLLINFNKCFAFDDYEIVFSDEAFYLEATDHLNYEPTDTVSSNLHKNSEDTTLHFVTDYSNDETTETIESGLTTEEELVTVINIPYNNWDKEFLEMLEQYISIKGNIKIKEYHL